MTQAELLAQLRDIHLPAATTSTPVPDAFALWPIIAFAIGLAIVLAASYWRRTAWRRQARAALKAIEAESDLAQRWSSLLAIAATIARKSGRPDIVPRSAYRHPSAVTNEDATALGLHLRREIVR